MNIGSIYKVKKYFWLLFPTKETAATANVEANAANAAAMLDARTTANEAGWWSRAYNCEVTYFSPDSIIVFLEEKGKYKKVLTSEGRIGWTWFTEGFNYCFEEVKREQ